MPGIQLYTPRDENLSAGMVCFDVKGTKPEEVVKRLLAQRIVASTTPYRVSYARVACSIVNTPQEVETVLEQFVNWRNRVLRVSPAFAQLRRGRQRRGYRVSVVNASMNSRDVSALSNRDRIVSSFTILASVPTQTR